MQQQFIGSSLKNPSEEKLFDEVQASYQHCRKEFRDAAGIYVHVEKKEVKLSVGNPNTFKRMGLFLPEVWFWQKRFPKHALKTLTELQITNCGLKHIPEELMYLRDLQVLDLSKNRLKSLLRVVELLHSLNRIMLSENEFSSIPKGIERLPNLKYLFCNQNKVRALSPSFGRLASLKGLFLNHNPISSLPEEIGKLTNLVELELTHTSLCVLPESMKSLTNLESLDVTGTQLKSFPESIKNAVKLSKLSVHELLKNLDKIPSLTKIYVATLPKKRSFTSLKNCPILSLFFWYGPKESLRKDLLKAWGKKSFQSHEERKAFFFSFQKKINANAIF